jgi:integrating conjugative element protein (TIGR03752 family)
MARLKSNLLLPGLVLVVLGAAGAVAYVAITGAQPDFVLFQPRASIDKPPSEPTADTPADTIRVLQAVMNATNTHAQSLIKQNEQLQIEIRQLRGQENRIRDEVRSQVLTETKQTREADQHNARTQLDAVTRDIASLRSQMSDRLPPVPMTVDRPPLAAADPTYQWIQPLDQVDSKGGRGPSVRPAGWSEGPGRTSGPAGVAATAPQIPGVAERIEPQARPATPWFTIPALSSLVGSTTMTAMIGRIPRSGQVQDAVPFRVLVGRDNLAASGLFVPEAVFGMVFEGVAVGDYALSCSYGNIDAATFIFQDGTIRSVDLKRRGGSGNAGSGNSNAGGGADAGGGGGTTKRLAYVADRFGTPCVSGTRVGNAEQILGLRIALTAAEAAAQAAAAAQTTTTTGSALGTSTTSVTGNLGPYIAGRTAADSFKEIDKYFAGRLDDIFEAVFVPAGQEVAIMIQQEITLDHEPDGRRLTYGVQSDRSRSHLD